MEILTKQPSVQGPAEWFTGVVHFDVIAPGTASRGKVNAVHFAPGARTAWHRHAHGQTLHVTEGVGLTQSRGGDVVVIRPGDTVWCPPGATTPAKRCCGTRNPLPGRHFASIR